MKKLASIVMGVIASSFVMSAQSMPQMTFGPDQAKLSFLEGNFKTETHLLPNQMMPDGSTGTGTMSLAWGVDSLFLIMNTESSSSVLGSYKALGVLGYDPNAGNYILSMFNNFADHPTYTGNFSGDTLVLEGKQPFRGGSFDQKIMWYKEGDHVHLRILNDMGDGMTPVIDETETPVTESK
jgi:Protein of unknown function (DUF1579)